MNPPADPSATAIKYWWEDFPAGSVHPYGPMQVTREAVLEFAAQWDPQPFHLDDAAAEASLFKKLSASGWQTACMTMRMQCDAFLLQSSSLGSPGLDALKWHKPVYPGDTLRGTLTVLDARPMNSKPEIGLVQSRWETVNQRDERVLTMEGWGMFRRRPDRQEWPTP